MKKGPRNKARTPGGSFSEVFGGVLSCFRLWNSTHGIPDGKMTSHHASWLGDTEGNRT